MVLHGARSMRVLHVGPSVRDARPSARWYRELFGMETPNSRSGTPRSVGADLQRASAPVGAAIIPAGAPHRSAYSPSVATIRPATVQDALAVGRLNVRVWQVAYGLPVRAACGQLPDEHLDGLRPEERAAGWERGLSRDRDQDLVL